MQLGSVVVIDNYIVSNATKECEIPYVFGVVDTVEKKYVNVFQYLDEEKILKYVNGLSSKLETSFKRFTSAFPLDGKVIYLVIFHAETVRSAKHDSESVRPSAINSAVADRAGAPMTAVKMDDNPVISSDPTLTRFINMITKVIRNISTNNRFSDVHNKSFKIDEGFFYPVKRMDMSELNNKYKSLVNDILVKSDNLKDINLFPKKGGVV